jgi:hypothetical protein
MTDNGGGPVPLIRPVDADAPPMPCDRVVSGACKVNKYYQKGELSKGTPTFSRITLGQSVIGCCKKRTGWDRYRITTIQPARSR